MLLEQPKRPPENVAARIFFVGLRIGASTKGGNMSLTEANPTLEDLLALDLRSIEAAPFADCSRFAVRLLASESLPPKGSAGWKAHVLVGFAASLRLDVDKPEKFKLDGRLFDDVGPTSFTEEQIAVLAQWLPHVRDPDLRARIADCLWLIRKPRDHQAGRTAVEAYIAAASLLAVSESCWTDAIDRFERAFQLAGNFQMTTNVTAAVETAIDDAGDTKFGPRKARLMRLLIEARTSDPVKYGPVAEALAQQGELEAVPEPPGTNKLLIASEYWTTAADWRARELGRDHAAVKSLRVRAAEAHVLLADKSRDAGDAMVEALHLNSATRMLRKVGAPRERVEMLIERMMAAQRDAPIATISASIDLTKEYLAAQRHVAGRDFRLALLYLARVTNPPKKAALREMVDEHNKNFLAARLFPALLTTADHRIAKHMPALSDREDTELEKENNRAVIQWQMWKEAQWLRGLTSGIIEGARRQVLLEHNPSIADLIPLVSGSWMVPPGHEGLFAKGLHAGFHGEFAIACHLLVPQFENGLRMFAQESLGKTLVSINKDGTQMAGLLTRLLNLPELVAVLGEDLIFDLQGLLVMQESVNFRNNLSHGLLRDSDIDASAIYFWWLCIRICVQLTPIQPSKPAEPA